MVKEMSRQEPIPSARRDVRGSGNGSLRKFAYEQIEDLLNSGRLKPGQLISQRELVDLTGATLGSIRESVPRFEAEGLLVTVPKKGLMVPSLDVTFVRDAYQVRRMIEYTAVPDMIRRFDDRTIAAFIDKQKALEAELLENGPNASPQLLDLIQREDWNMHAAFVRTMSNRLIDNIYRVTAIKIRMAVQSRLQVTGDNAERILGEHYKILEALAARDQEKTERALMQHIDNSLHIALGGNIDRIR
ncbi:GntR family transcriptional regulator [Pelagibacterium halotolerans]|uniref:GntR family transcriptional regulator n=1 Tax=Pelagibacterium halotolerans TaxID=531813 RepID=UPI00384FE874